MAEKVRCISNAILNNDNFITLPNAAKVLYVYINNETDDAGFCDHVNGIMRTIGARKSDLKALIDRGYLYEVCGSWLYLEKHFFINNRGLRRDRLRPSRYAEYLNPFILKDNGAYTLKDKHPELADKMATNCRQNGDKTRQNVPLIETNIKETNINNSNITKEKEKEKESPQNYEQLKNDFVRAYAERRRANETTKPALL